MERFFCAGTYYILFYPTKLLKKIVYYSNKSVYKHKLEVQPVRNGHAR